MRNCRIAILLAIFFVFGVSANADPILIYDTGPGITATGGNALYSTQSLGKQIQFGSDYRLTTVDGWMMVYTPGIYRISIYHDSNNRPGTWLGSWNTVLSATSISVWQSFDVDFLAYKDTNYFLFF